MASTVLFQSSPFATITYPQPHFIPFHPLQSPPRNRTQTLIGSFKISSSPKPSRFTGNCNARSTNYPNPSPNSRIEASSNRFGSGLGLGFDVVVEKILNVFKGLRKPAVAIILMGLLLMYDPNSSASAASGGRVGGSAFTSRSSSSSSRSSSSSSGGYSTSTRFIDPGVSFSAPYYAPTPFGGGGYFVGPAFGVGIGVGSNLLFILMGFAAFVLVSGVLSERDGGSVLVADSEKTTVLKLQVGLLGMARSLQEELNRIARAADTSTPQGLNYILTETTLALLRNPDYWISAYSSVDVKRSIDAGEKRFNQLSIEERGKFNEETLVNVNNIKKQSSLSRKPGGFSNEYIVVTVLVAAEGVHKLPIINGSNDLKEALEKLGSIPSNKTMAVEVLWTPQDVNDTLTERELLEDYSLLRPL